MKSRIVGIDLGTSTSEIAVFENGRVQVIQNKEGDKITPSVVGMSEDNKLIVGKDAHDQFILRPDKTIMEIKRLMGSKQTVEMDGKQFKPEEISANILSYLKECAEEYLDETVYRAVITVPAYFTDEQRRATVEAGRLAGFKVERIINEPTAAALTYGIDRLEENEHVLVYDLGGGTLDVTILEMFDGILEVKASSGNNKLGGKDFDERLIKYFVNKFYEIHNIDISTDVKAMVRLKEAAETCKKQLSSNEQYKVVLPFIAEKDNEPIAMDIIVNKTEFEGLIEDLINSTRKQIDIVLKDSGVKINEINTILLVGGSTRIPLVKNFLKEVFGKEPEDLVDPDLAVVMGASIQSAILNDDLSAETDILITDVCPYTLGIGVLDFIDGIPVPDSYSIIIKRNTTIPVVQEKIYCTSYDEQSKVEIEVYQGDYIKASMNNLLGKFILSDIPEGPAGKESIKVRFNYDVNGILNVKATVLSTGKNASITLETTGVEEEVDLEGWKDIEESRKYRILIKKVERYMEEHDDNSDLDYLLKDLKKAIITGNFDLADDLKEQLTDTIFELEDK